MLPQIALNFHPYLLIDGPMNKGYLELMLMRNKQKLNDTNSRDQKNIRFKLTLVNSETRVQRTEKSLSLFL